MDLLLMKKRTLFCKIQAVRAHESERVSWASQLSLQTLDNLRDPIGGAGSSNSLINSVQNLISISSRS
jgi:hypothetical protein